MSTSNNNRLGEHMSWTCNKSYELSYYLQYILRNTLRIKTSCNQHIWQSIGEKETESLRESRERAREEREREREFFAFWTRHHFWGLCTTLGNWAEIQYLYIWLRGWDNSSRDWKSSREFRGGLWRRSSRTIIVIGITGKICWSSTTDGTPVPHFWHENVCIRVWSWGNIKSR